MKPKLYVYPHVGPQLHETTAGFENSIPMNKVGRERNCEIVTDPAKADYFYAGQVAWQHFPELGPHSFKYFAGNESRHIIDCEGDWRDYDQPDWLAESLVITGHVRVETAYKFKRRFVRPVISPLMMRLVKNPPSFTVPVAKGYWFQGQMDFTYQNRGKVAQALAKSGCPGEWYWNNAWGCYLPEDHEAATTYLSRAQHWSYALCPMGEGPTCRYYEMALLNRIPVLIADYVPFEGGIFRWSMKLSVDELAAKMKAFYLHSEAMDWFWQMKTMEYCTKLRKYFDEPTAYFLEWAKTQR